MDKQEPFSEIRYFFGGELRLYRDFFESHCPPPMKMNRGMQICRQEETKNWMYYLCRGQLKVYASNYEGNERMVAILGEDSLAGLDCLIPGQFSLMTIECLTDCWLMPLQNTVLDAMIRENPDFAVAITHYYCKILRQLCFDATSQSISSVMIRLANFLRTNWNEPEKSRVRLSQQELAAAVNCSRASIARVCRILKNEGIIAIEGVGFRIIDPDKLDMLCHKYRKLP